MILFHWPQYPLNPCPSSTEESKSDLKESNIEKKRNSISGQIFIGWKNEQWKQQAFYTY